MYVLADKGKMTFIGDQFNHFTQPKVNSSLELKILYKDNLTC